MFSMRKILPILLVLAVLVLPAAAAGDEVSVELMGRELSGARLLRDTTFVPVRAFSERMGSRVGWDAASGAVTIEDESFTARYWVGSRELAADGRWFLMPEEVFEEDGVTYVPVRSLATLYGLELSWDAAASRAVLTGGSEFCSASGYYSEADLYWLSHIIFAESGNQPLEGQIAVGNVVMNRVRSKEFPDSVKGVVFDDRGCIQFTPVENGTIWLEPSEESVKAAKMVLEGAETVTDDTLYFVSKKVPSTNWIKRTCRWITTIGAHAFYANPY